MINPETRNCQNCHGQFTIEPEDFNFYEKIKVPPPTFCPECRRQRRLSWRNDYIFYNRECDLCHRKIISIYSPENPQIIYCNLCWWSDRWDPKGYGQEFDFSRPFFDQFCELRQRVPALALVNDNGIGSENCEYVQNVQYSKNCYMAMVSWKMENCMYFSYGADAKDAVDCMGIFSVSGGIYETLYSEKCYGSRYIQNSNSLLNCAFCYDCHGCEECFMSVSLRGKKYFFKNESYTKEEYQNIVSQYKLDTWSGNQRALAEFENFLLSRPHKFASFLNCVNVTGNNLTYSKNAREVFHVRRAENCRYLESGDTEKDSYDLCVGGELEQCYEGLTPDHSYRAAFTNYTWKSRDVLYTDFCMSCEECFGCVGLKHAQYSIFNKQYPKEEYVKLKQKIIDRMKQTKEYGEFFPMEISPFAYNESMAQVSFPLSREQIRVRGLRFEKHIQQTRGKTTLRDVPDSIADVTDSVLQEVLECTECGRNYKIVPDELSFYRKWKIPIPRKCFYCRLQRRFNLRGPSMLWHRKCTCDGGESDNKAHKNSATHFHGTDHCLNEFETTYSPDRKEIVYCEECYNAEIV